MSQNKNNPQEGQIRIGEKVQIGLEGHPQPYPTLLEDILDDGRFIVSSPMYRGIPLPVHEGQEVQFYFYREDGRYCIFSKIDEIFMHNELRLLRLMPLSEPIKQQRRESFRLPISLGARICSFDEEAVQAAKRKEQEDANWETTITHNISETGVSIKSRQEYKVGDMVTIWMKIEDGAINEQMNLMGIVRQAEKLDSTKEHAYRLGIEFMPYEEAKRRSIAQFILKKQRLILKMKRNQYPLYETP